MRATIKMIAEKAGVSIGTVDRVLHDRPYVKAEVRSRVLQVMEELHYRPNHMASALATSGTAPALRGGAAQLGGLCGTGHFPGAVPVSGGAPGL